MLDQTIQSNYVREYVTLSIHNFGFSIIYFKHPNIQLCEYNTVIKNVSLSPKSQVLLHVFFLFYIFEYRSQHIISNYVFCHFPNLTHIQVIAQAHTEQRDPGGQSKIGIFPIFSDKNIVVTLGEIHRFRFVSACSSENHCFSLLFRKDVCTYIIAHDRHVK